MKRRQPPRHSGGSGHDELLPRPRRRLTKSSGNRPCNCLIELVGLDPNYRSEDVQAMRFDALRQQGLALVADERYEEALRALDQALVTRPGGEEVKAERELISLYVDALGLWRLDWARVVQDLETIKQRRPAFLDVGQRLALANDAWGDCLVKARANGAMAVGTLHEAVAADASPMRSQAKAHRSRAELPADPNIAGRDASSRCDAWRHGCGWRCAGGWLRTASSSRPILPRSAAGTSTGCLCRAAASRSLSPRPLHRPTFGPFGDFIVVRSERNDQTGLVVLSTSGATGDG